MTGSREHPLHIGIVACSTEGAALCYRTVSLYGSERAGPYRHPELSHALGEGWVGTRP